VGIEVVVEGLTKSFGRRNVWRNVSLTLPAGEVSVMLGPSGTGKTVFLKSLIGLVRPERGRVIVDGVDILHSSERKLYEARKLFGIMFQDGALFGSLNLYDNIAFPLREHTRKSESEIARIVAEKMALVGLGGEERKLPGEISGGMRKRAGLARALVLDPQIILCDEPDSGLDPVRTAYLSQLLINLNAEIDATMLIVTHNIEIARTVPDNIGMLFRRDLVMFGPRELLLTSEEPAVTQFIGDHRFGPIGMAEETDQADQGIFGHGEPGDGRYDGEMRIEPQLEPSTGLPARPAVRRRLDRVMARLHELPPVTRQAIIDSLGPADRARYDVAEPEPVGARSGPGPAAPRSGPGSAVPRDTGPLPRRQRGKTPHPGNRTPGPDDRPVSKTPAPDNGETS
jgi:phospholipid/cholesterol/gamma-HCH transport system ATP-binding protein